MSDFGFTIIKSNKVNLDFNFLFKIDYISRHGINYLFGYNSFLKFKKDKIFIEDADYIIGLDGVVLNLMELKNNYSIFSLFLLLVHLYKKRGQNMAIELKGNYNGFVFDKRKEELLFFSDKVASKQVFYYQLKKMIIISSNIKNIVKWKQFLSLRSYLDISACYNLLTFGGMIEDQTLIEDVKKINAGDYLYIVNENVLIERYFDFNDIDYSLTNKEKAIDLLDESFKKAVLLEYKKDQEYDYKYLATLSGGLDSRLGVMLANELSFKPDIFCFSQSNYLDEKIARNISNDLGLNFKFVPLDNGEYLLDLKKNVEVNNGLQFYLNAAHLNFALKKINIENYGLIHTGLAGDGVLGGFLTKKGLPDFYSNKISGRFTNKLKIPISFKKEYKNEEIFKLYQRVFNITNFGSYVVESQQSYLVSPFLDEDFLYTALSIEPKLKKQQIYLDWLKRKHSGVIKYKWENTGFKPDAKYKTELSRYTKKIKKEFFNLTNQQEKLSMNPEEFWLKNNLKNKQFFNESFEEMIQLLVGNMELYKNLTIAFEQGNINEKSAVLTILEIVKKFKLKI